MFNGVIYVFTGVLYLTNTCVLLTRLVIMIVVLCLYFKGNIVIVDTPGIGDNDQKGAVEKMMEYFPNALAFVFVINAAYADGLQENRVSIIISCVIFYHLYKSKIILF